MKAIVEIKTRKKIEDVTVVNAGTEKYNTIVNDILKQSGFEVVEVKVFEDYPEMESEYSSLKTDEASYILATVELTSDEISNFKLHETSIIDKVMDIISQRELDIVGASEFERESFIFFNN